MEEKKAISKYDHIRGDLEVQKNCGMVAFSKPHPVRHVDLRGWVEMYIVETARHVEKGDTLLIECIDDSEGSKIRLALPASVVKAIIRQQATVEKKALKIRKRLASEKMKARMAEGWVPGFMRKKEVGA